MPRLTNRKFKMTGVKLPPAIMDSFRNICESNNMSTYTALQNCIMFFVKLASKEEPLTDEMAKLMRQFEDLQVWSKKFNLADWSVKASVQSAIYILAGQGKSGCVGVRVDKPFMDQPSQTFNIQTILEDFLAALMPSFYRRLRFLGVELGTSTVYETLDKILDLQHADPDEASIRDMFSELANAEAGQSQYAHKNTASNKLLFDDIN